MQREDWRPSSLGRVLAWSGVSHGRIRFCRVGGAFPLIDPHLGLSSPVERCGMAREPGLLTLSEDDRRLLAPWAADCAERALPSFEAVAANDSRPREALIGLRAFARGTMRIGEVRALAVQAHAAARGVSDPAAVAVARAAGQAAGVAHMAAHARGAAAYAAMAAGLAEPEDRHAVKTVIAWQRHHAPADVLDALRSLPAPIHSASLLPKLISDLDSALRAN